MVTNYLINVSLLALSGLVCLVLLICALVVTHLKQNLEKIFIMLVIGQLAVIAVDIVIYATAGSVRPYIHEILWAASFLSFALGVILAGIFTWYFMSFLLTKITLSKKAINAFRVVFVTCGINLILTFVSLFNGMYFTITETNRFMHGNYHLLATTLGMVVVVVNGGAIIAYRKALRVQEFGFLLCYVLLPGIALAAVMVLDGVNALFDVATTLTLLVFYTGLQSELSHRKELEIMQKELELVQSRIAAMTSQIQPHFIYNSLTAIKTLCRTDPGAAAETVDEFSSYLRHNIDSLSMTRPVSFIYELKHVETYLAIEKKRFGDKLNVVYDISVQDFDIPALTLQPIVENAVRHGVTSVRKGGTITVSTREENNDVLIIVADDGVGFDPEKNNDKNTHTGIGIENARNRLSAMVGGSIDVQSEINKGTTVTITIRKQEE